MRMTAIAIAFLAMTSASSAQLLSGEYVINATLLAASRKSPGTLETLAKPTLRTVEGRAATMMLGEDANSISISVTPSDLGAGKVALHVAVEARMAGRIASAKFDLLSGAGLSTPTVALRDAGGDVVIGADGRPLFVAFDATRRQ